MRAKPTEVAAVLAVSPAIWPDQAAGTTHQGVGVADFGTWLTTSRDEVLPEP